MLFAVSKVLQTVMASYDLLCGGDYRNLFVAADKGIYGASLLTLNTMI